MKGIKIECGFACEIQEDVLDNMELLELLVEVEEGKPAALIPALDMILGKEKRKELYGFLRTADGRVPVKDTTVALAQIVKAAGRKN